MECFLLAPQWMPLHASQSAWSPLWRPLTQMPLAAFIYSAAKSLQSCPTLCNPMDGSLPGSPIPGILQARTLEGVAISFSSAWKWKVKVKSLSCVWPSATPWTAAYQAPPSMGFSRQEYWSRVPLPSPSYTLTGGNLERCLASRSCHGITRPKPTCLYIDILWFTMELWPD